MIKYIKKVVDISDSHSINRIIMCSSGVDSIAATHYILSKHKDKIRYQVLHFNHKLRPQNDLMQESVVRFMMEKFPSHIYYTPSRTKHASTEAELREERLNYIRSVFHHNVIITAHHLDDCVESYLMNCFRGHTDYLPIPFWSEIKGNDLYTTNTMVHPFLFTKKQDFINYAIKNDLMKYVVEDETNKVTKGSRRNLIRNEIIPILQREEMGIDTIVKKKLKQRLMLELLKYS